ncbi:MAG: hypothetical protein OHK0045_09460 [Raineya sp.]
MKTLKTYLLLIFWICSTSIFAQNNSPKLRSFDKEKLEEIRKKPEFSYEEDIEQYKEYDADWEYKRWRWEEEQRKKMKEDTNWKIKKIRTQEGANLDLKLSLGQSAIYIASAIAIIFLLLALLGIDVRSFFRKNKVIPTENFTEQDWQELDKGNLDKLIDSAIGKEQYNLAIKYAFLKSLQLLEQKKYIQLQRQKTNAEYQAELSKAKKSVSEGFKWQSKVFAYIQYGEFEVSKKQFEVIYPRFQSFYQSI